MEIVLSVFGIIVSAIAGAFVNKIWHTRQLRNPYSKTTGIKSGEKTIIVIPHRPLLSALDHLYSGSHTHVTYEDMLAANYVERSLTLAGVSDQNIEIHSVHQFLRDRAQEDDQNLVLICSPKANPVTTMALDILNANVPGFSIKFCKLDDKDEKWCINFEGALLKSPSYDQVDQLVKINMRPEEGMQSDYGVLARVPNPWNINRKMLIVAGIRGIGTWGAARYLREHPDEILKRSNGGDFVCIVNVKYDNFKMATTHATSFFSCLSTR
jgi:hypothetical protein